MALFIAIVGLPNVGKSTLFNALTGGSAIASNYPFATVDPNVGVVEVPDPRLFRLRKIIDPSSCTPTTIRFVDIAGLVRGASQGEGLGNTFLGQIREADALVHVLRCFEAQQIAHVDGAVDPIRDIETIQVELILADLSTVEQTIPRLEKIVQTESTSARQTELQALKNSQAALERGDMIKEAKLSEEERSTLASYKLLTGKPVLYLANVSEEDARSGGLYYQKLASEIGEDQVIVVSAQIESELAQLPLPDREDFLRDLDLEESGLSSLIRAAYCSLNLITFYTAANDKLEAWQLPKGTAAQMAAGKIHSQMQEGFIRAEVVSSEELERVGDMNELRNQGKVRTEGREYEIQEGDIVHFLFRP